MQNRERLSGFLKDVISWDYQDFLSAEADESYSMEQSAIFALVRECTMENLSAIKMAINRVDGKLETPVRIALPKVYYIYPNATEVEPSQAQIASSEIVVAEPEELVEKPTKGLRDTLDRMMGMPRNFAKKVIQCQKDWEAAVRGLGSAPTETVKVSTVMVAHLMNMAQSRDIDAINEVFDSIDGKLVETIKMVGEDMYIVQFGKIAPPGAQKNDDGVYMIEASGPQAMWHKKLSNKVDTIYID